MKRRMICLAPIAWAALYVAAVPHAQAAFVATFSEVAGNVVVNGIGTLDLVDLSFGSVAEEVPTLIATPAFSILGHGRFRASFPHNRPPQLGSGNRGLRRSLRQWRYCRH